MKGAQIPLKAYYLVLIYFVAQDLEVDIDDMSGLKYFYKYSMAAYGCWWYVMDSPCMHCCSLGSYIEYCPCFPCMQPQVYYLYLYISI